VRARGVQGARALGLRVRAPGPEREGEGGGPVRAALARDEQATTTITAPKGFKLVTLAFDHASRLGARTENVYVGKRSVRLTLFADRNHVAAGQTGRATIYALARRGGF
jgi:hypothetical protein